MEDVATIIYLSVLMMNLSIYKQHAMKWRILVVCIEGGRVTDCGVDVFADLERKADECRYRGLDDVEKLSVVEIGLGTDKIACRRR